MQRKFGRKALTLVGAVALLMPGLARAETCAAEIARVQKLLDQARAGEAVVPDLPETNFATMHRQPTRQSVASAKAEADDKAAALLEQARKEEAEGNHVECLKTLKTIVLPGR